MLIPHYLDEISLPDKLPPLVLIAFNRPDLIYLEVQSFSHNQSLCLL